MSERELLQQIVAFLEHKRECQQEATKHREYFNPEHCDCGLARLKETAKLLTASPTPRPGL